MGKTKRNILFDKLNRFISKYYKDKILKGFIFLAATLLFFLLLFSILEYFSRFNSSSRSLLFWLYIIINSSIFIGFILIPILKLFRLGNTLNYTDAAKIIGKYFSDIDDKILNILQLNKLSDRDNGLISASIDQKTNNISVFSFRKVVNFKENKKYLKLVLIPLLFILIFIFSGNGKLITESSARIINHNTEYIPKSPFSFIIKNNNLSCLQFEDFNLEVNISGEKIPANVFIEIDNNRFSLVKDNITDFHFLFKNINKDIEFKFFANGFYSSTYTLKSLLKPSISGFSVFLDYPKYTNLPDEKLDNIGDGSVPEGTKIKWDFDFKNSDSLFFEIEEKMEKHKIYNNQLQINKSVNSNLFYSVSTKNNNIVSDKTNYKISVIKDEFPKIHLESTLDSSTNQLFFSGDISDDYSLKKLVFSYSVSENDSSYSFSEEIKINNLSSEKYYHYLDVSSLNLNPSDKLTYYFEVWDNDGVNGSKSVKTFVGLYQEISVKEIKEKRDNENEKIKDNLDESIELSLEIQKEIEELKKSLINKKTLGWEEKKKAENVIKKQKQLENLIKENNKKNSNKNKIQKKLNSTILEKQKKLEELMDKVLDEESKKLMEDLQKLLEEMNKEDLKEVLDKMEKDNSDLEKELDRNLELFKELEFEQKLEETIDKIDELKKKQEELKEKTDDKKSESEELGKKQEKLQEELNELEKELEKLDKQNSELEQKKDLPNLEEEKKEVSKSMEESKKELDKKQKKQSSKKQKKTIEKLEEMSEKMKGLQSSCSNDKPVEDMETLRQILENLITLSFEEEELINKISLLPKNSNSIVKYIQHQKKLSDDSQIIEDSLLALSKRVVQIESIINKEISSINYNMEKSISLLEERKISVGVAKQQFVMTSVNNLALLLSETLKQMQLESSCNKPGTKQCNKPGSSSKPSLSELKKLQKKLQQQMKDKKGEKGKEGEKNKKNGNCQSKEGQSKELMQLAQQQQQIRERLQELRDEIGENGEKGNIDRILEKMEESETDILNNNITNETLLRQEEILTKLLEAEESQRERGEEEKRESIEWNYEIKNNSSEYLEYLQKKKDQEELLKTTPIQLNPFYKKKVNEYFNNLTDE